MRVCVCVFERVSHTLGGVPSLLTVDFNFPSAKQVDDANSEEEITA